MAYIAFALVAAWAVFTVANVTFGHDWSVRWISMPFVEIESLLGSATWSLTGHLLMPYLVMGGPFGCLEFGEGAVSA